jgi:hypothetical protein
LPAYKQSHGNQRFKFSLKARGRGFQMAGQFGHVPPVLRLEHSGGKDTGPNRREERVEGAADTHIE